MAEMSSASAAVKLLDRLLPLCFFGRRGALALLFLALLAPGFGGGELFAQLRQGYSGATAGTGAATVRRHRLGRWLRRGFRLGFGAGSGSVRESAPASVRAQAPGLAPVQGSVQAG